MRVYVTTQVIQRELDSRLLLSAHLTALGHTVSFGPRPALHAHWRIHGPGVYVLSNAARKWFIDQPETAGLTFAILDEEALLIDDEERFVRMRVEEGVIERCEQYFCWGEHHRDVVASAFPSALSKLHVAGNPRFELLEPRFHAIYAAEADEIRARYGERIVLINSNIQEWRTEAQLVTIRGHLKELARALAAHRPDVTVVYRPHPTEHETTRIDATGLPNLVVTADGPIAPWLVGASAVFHNSCTTAIEARVMERPVFAYRPVADPPYGALPNALSVTVRSTGEACAALDVVLAGDPPAHPDLTPLDRFLVRPGSGEPSRRIAEKVAGLAVPDASVGPARPGALERLRVRRKGAPAKPWNRIALRERLPAIQERYAQIAEAAGLDHSVAIHAPQPNLIDVTPH